MRCWVVALPYTRRGTIQREQQREREREEHIRSCQNRKFHESSFSTLCRSAVPRSRYARINASHTAGCCPFLTIVPFFLRFKRPVTVGIERNVTIWERKLHSRTWRWIVQSVRTREKMDDFEAILNPQKKRTSPAYNSERTLCSTAARCKRDLKSSISSFVDFKWAFVVRYLLRRHSPKCSRTRSMLYQRNATGTNKTAVRSVHRAKATPTVRFFLAP